MDNKDQSESVPQPAKRQLIKGLAAFAAGVMTDRFIGTPTSTVTNPNPSANTEQNFVLKQAIPMPEIVTDEKILNHILELDPYSPEKIIEEAAYLGRAESVQQIDKGFWVMNSKDLRGALLHKRHRLRERGILPMNVSLEEIRWARSQGIHPETLALCKTAEPGARKIIKNEDQMINIGGLAKLMTEETGRALGGSDVSYAFNYVGEQAAEKHINPVAFPKDKAALVELCAKLSADTGLTFNPQKIAGSYRGNQLSGGAIGAQFMPSTALEIYQLMEATGEKFNPFDPISAIIGAWVYLAKRGYLRGNPQAIEKAVKGWNNDSKEAARVISAANSYYDGFIQKPTPILAHK